MRFARYPPLLRLPRCCGVSCTSSSTIRMPCDQAASDTTAPSVHGAADGALSGFQPKDLPRARPPLQPCRAPYAPASRRSCAGKAIAVKPNTRMAKAARGGCRRTATLRARSGAAGRRVALHRRCPPSAAILARLQAFAASRPGKAAQRPVQGAEAGWAPSAWSPGREAEAAPWAGATNGDATTLTAFFCPVGAVDPDLDENRGAGQA